MSDVKTYFISQLGRRRVVVNQPFDNMRMIVVYGLMKKTYAGLVFAQDQIFSFRLQRREHGRRGVEKNL